MTDSPENTPTTPDDSAPETPDTTTPVPSETPAAAKPVARKPEPLYNDGQPAAPSAPTYRAPAAPVTPTPSAAPTSAAPASPAPAAPAYSAPAAASAQPTLPIAGAGVAAGAAGAGTPNGPSDHTFPSAAAKPSEPGASFKRRAPLALVAAFAAVALVGGVSGAGVTFWALSQNGGNSAQVNAQPANITVNDADNATIVTAVAAKASPSVVTISTKGSSGAGTGSGVVIDDQGHILTNTHVVTLDGAAANATVSVQTSDGRLLDAKIVGTDPISDLAVIKVEASAKLPFVDFADSSKLNVGDTAIAIGAPLGLTTTVTNGIISALNRSITIASSAVPEESDTGEQAPDDNSGENPFDFWQFDVPGEDAQTPSSSSGTIQLAVIQTDAAINPGNSGGALLDAEGDIIGINVAIASSGGGSSSAAGNIGVGFAIPANLAKRVAAEIIADGSATHGLLGASILDVTEDTAATSTLTVGASVKEVVPGGAAANGGLKVGDVITGINGLPITGKNDLTAQVRALAAGADATITYVRNGKTATLDVTLGKL